MVIHCDVSVNDLVKLGKNYPWERPKCPKCNEKVWWHGFVMAYFGWIVEGVYLRRCRCPRCHSVHRLKPKGFFPRFWWHIEEIRDVIEHRTEGRYPKGKMIPRSNMKRWWQNLIKRIQWVFGFSCTMTPAEGFDELICKQFIPVKTVKIPEETHEGSPTYPRSPLPEETPR